MSFQWAWDNFKASLKKNLQLNDESISNLTREIKYNYELGGQIQGQEWTRKMYGKPVDGGGGWARRNRVFLESCSFCPYIPDCVSIPHTVGKGSLQCWEGTCPILPHPSLFRILLVQTFCLTELHLLHFTSQPTMAQQVLFTMWCHCSNYGGYINQQNKDPTFIDLQFKGGKFG